MSKSSPIAHELIRRVIEGRNPAGSARKLVTMGAGAVQPVLEALAGHHGPFHNDEGQAQETLMKVLVNIAKKDATPLAEAMAHDVPSLNAAVWALGHSSSRHAQAVVKSCLDHEDGAIRSVAEYHSTRRRPAARKKKVAKKKTARRKAAKKKPARKAAKKKARARKRR